MGTKAAGCRPRGQTKIISLRNKTATHLDVYTLHRKPSGQQMSKIGWGRHNFKGKSKYENR